MTNAKTGHFGKNAGHSSGTFPRARARPYGDKFQMSQCPSVPKNGTGQLFDGTGQNGLKAAPSHPVGTEGGLPKPTMSWMHIAAMNLIAEHDAGTQVDQRRLEAARALLGRVTP